MNADHAQHANAGRHSQPLPFAQTGRVLTETDWKFEAALPKLIGEDAVRVWMIYEYARESSQLREWARLIHIGFGPRARTEQRMDARECSGKITDLFASYRDGWLGWLLVSVASHLKDDKPWAEIDQQDRNECVQDSIAVFQGLHFFKGNTGNVRRREIGVRLASRAARAALCREEFEEREFKPRSKTPSQEPRETEVFTFEIHWTGLRDEELKAAFGAWLPYLRPKEHPQPAAVPRAVYSCPIALLKPALTDLGIMRLTHAHSPWQAEDISGKEAPARTDARNRARANFRSIFPSLGKDAVPRSDKLWTARQ